MNKLKNILEKIYSLNENSIKLGLNNMIDAVKNSMNVKATTFRKASISVRSPSTILSEQIISKNSHDEYKWESTFADGMIDAATVIDAQIRYTVSKLKSTIKVINIIAKANIIII
jgi:hypothetical protein